MNVPEWFSWRQNFLYSAMAFGGVLATHNLVAQQGEPTIGIVIGAVIGANIGAMIQTRRGKNPRFDELNRRIIDNSMIHGFITYTALIGYQALTTSSLTPMDEILTVTLVLLVSLIVQAVKFSDKLGELS